MQRGLTIWIVIPSLLAGCAVGPNYQRSDPPVPAGFRALESGITRDAPLPSGAGGWWTLFQDPELDRLLARAVEKNHDLRLALARVRLARALRGGAEAAYYPEGGIGGTAQWFRSTEAGFVGGAASGGGAVGGGQRDGELYNAAFDASWEIDVFGAVRREVEAAQADWEASREAWRDTLISLQGEVGRNYIEIRALQLRLRIAREDALMREEIVHLSEARNQAGLIAEQELARNRGALANAQSVIPTLEKNWWAAVHRLGVLLGEGPTALVQELGLPADLPPVPGDLPAGLPSDLLRRRPDIRKAERELAAATARIGVARADLFPRFSLTGSFGLQSRNTGNLADEGSSFWRIGPTFRWNILNLQRILSSIEAGEAVREGALVQYERAVQAALEEVENALVTLSREKRRTEVLLEAVEANGLAAELAFKRYQAGLESYLAVIDARNALLLSQDQLAQSRQQKALGLVALYKALGGGWQEPAPPEGETR
jgi:NodT family efflux transporter outer membrane factor (OMF) lipoprotein